MQRRPERTPYVDNHNEEEMSKPMTTTAEEIAEDANFLRELAEARAWRAEDIARLNRIADNVEMMSVAMFETSLQLEKRAEKEWADLVEGIVERLNPSPTEKSGGFRLTHQGVAHAELQTVALWLIYRQLKSGATKALFGQGLSALGLAAAANLSGGAGKPEDDGSAH